MIVGATIDIPQICGLPPQARAVIDDLALYFTRAKIYEGHRMRATPLCFSP